MGDKSIRKEAKKPKKSDGKNSSFSVSAVARPAVVQPELIKKEKKNK